MPTYGYSLDQEAFQGDFATRAAAHQAGVEAWHEATAQPRRGQAPDATGQIWTGENGPPPHASTLVPSVLDFVDYLQNEAFDRHGEFADSWPRLDTDQQAQIQVHLDAIAALIQAADAPVFYAVTAVQEHPVNRTAS